MLLLNSYECARVVESTAATHIPDPNILTIDEQPCGLAHLHTRDEIFRRKSCSGKDMAAESLLAERQARRDLSHTMPADRHRGNNQAYHIVHKLIVGWTTWKMRMGFMGKPLVADVVVFFLHWTDILLQFLAAKV